MYHRILATTMLYHAYMNISTHMNIMQLLDVQHQRYVEECPGVCSNGHLEGGRCLHEPSPLKHSSSPPHEGLVGGGPVVCDEPGRLP